MQLHAKHESGIEIENSPTEQLQRKLFFKLEI